MKGDIVTDEMLQQQTIGYQIDKWCTIGNGVDK